MKTASLSKHSRYLKSTVEMCVKNETSERNLKQRIGTLTLKRPLMKTFEFLFMQLVRAFSLPLKIVLKQSAAFFTLFLYCSSFYLH